MSSCSSYGGAGNCSPMKGTGSFFEECSFMATTACSRRGQKLLVDVDAWMDLRSAVGSDDIEKSVSYAELYEQIKAVVEGPPFKLVETVANVIAQAIFSAHPSTIFTSDRRVGIY